MAIMGCVFVYVPVRITYLDTLLPHQRLEVERIGHFTLLMILNQTITILYIFKMFHAIKMVDSLNILATLIVECIYDILPFSFFLLLSILSIAFLRIIVGVEVESDDYPLVPNFMQQIIQTHRNSVGDIAAPTYNFWTKQADNNPYLSRVAITMVWGNWLTNQILILTILLNFLIGSIS